MAKLFQNAGNQNLSERQMLEARYNRARSNLLLVIVFSVINIILLVSQSDTYFLFSAFIPYMLVVFGMTFCGIYPEEYYTGDLEGIEFLDKSIFVVLLVIAVIILVLYLLGWLLSKKLRVGWLIFTLVFFSLDTLGIISFSGISSENLIDIAFHALVIFYLCSGIHSYYKIKKLPVEDEVSLISESDETTE